jgi:hypothetical protein
MIDPVDAPLDAWDEGDLDAELADAALVYCPYCGEEVEVTVDPAGGELQEYVEDCEVCCQPWSVRVWVDGDGVPSVTVTTLDDG